MVRNFPISRTAICSLAAALGLAAAGSSPAEEVDGPGLVRVAEAAAYSQTMAELTSSVDRDIAERTHAHVNRAVRAVLHTPAPGDATLQHAGAADPNAPRVHSPHSVKRSVEGKRRVYDLACAKLDSKR